nr:hypothetical protein [uncultured Carboxylicivirga sp.]
MTRNYKGANLGSILFVALLILSCSTAMAQKKVVKVKVVTNGDSSTVEVDTTLTNEVMIFDFDDFDSMNIDSIIQAHTKDLDQKMKVMAFKMDSLSDMDFNFNFDFDSNMEEMQKEVERIMKEKGIEMKDWEGFNMSDPHKMIFIGDGDGENTVDVESFIDEDGNHVKVIKKSVVVRGTGDEEVNNEKKVIVKSLKDDVPVKWNTKATISVEPIPIEEVAFLQKIGISTKKLLNEPLKVKDFKIKLDKKIDNDIKHTFLHVECILPEGGKYDMEMIKKDGEVKMKEEKIPFGEMKKEVEVQEDDSPYYLILSKNNKIFGRKITL